MRGEFFLFYSYSSVAGGPLLVALVAGEAAVKFERMSPIESVSRVLEILKGIFSPKGIAVPDPEMIMIFSQRTSLTEFFLLEKPLTNSIQPQCMGLFSVMRGCSHNEGRWRRSVAPAAQVNTVKIESKDLDPLFETPDLAFGSFSILFDPQSTDMESNALLRVAVGSEKSDSDNIYLYGYIERKQAIELNTLEEDVKRMEMLTHNFQVRLVGRNSLCNAAESLISRIKSGKSASA
ncbi:UNVERIFIED_CONTAM: Lysine-specific histone demethylase 11 [Sesamum radiatum]|uniref:Lysine-specific histone demethylase 11 n=1 Tax=Sesamum radiatum TaxID=300843 RepID=A0AAW2SP08_SESRA